MKTLIVTILILASTTFLAEAGSSSSAPPSSPSPSPSHQPQDQNKNQNQNSVKSTSAAAASAFVLGPYKIAINMPLPINDSFASGFSLNSNGVFTAQVEGLYNVQFGYATAAFSSKSKFIVRVVSDLFGTVDYPVLPSLGHISFLFQLSQGDTIQVIYSGSATYVQSTQDDINAYLMIIQNGSLL